MLETLFGNGVIRFNQMIAIILNLNYIFLDVHATGRSGADGKRDVAALANPFEKRGWNDTIAEDGLIAMALGYRNTFYSGLKENGTSEDGNANPAFTESAE